MMRRLRRAICYLFGHRRRLHVGQFFGGMIRHEPSTTWLTCDRCYRLLRLDISDR